MTVELSTERKKRVLMNLPLDSRMIRYALPDLMKTETDLEEMMTELGIVADSAMNFEQERNHRRFEQKLYQHKGRKKMIEKLGEDKKER